LRPGVLESAARACHDIAVHVELRLAAAACAQQGQVWRVDENGIPVLPSAMFSNDGSVVNWVDESFAPTTGSGEFLPTTDLAARAWHPAGTHKTGRMFFSDLATGAFLSEFQVVDLRPEPGAYCSAHMGMPIMGGHKDLLVNAWYMGGADLIDFTNPRAPQGGRVLRHGAVRAKGLGYQGPTFKTGPGVPVCASDGVHNPNSARGSWCSGPGSEGRTPHGGPPEPADHGHVALAGRPRGSPDPPGNRGGRSVGWKGQPATARCLPGHVPRSPSTPGQLQPL
jgi:hypothetical protein